MKEQEDVNKDLDGQEINNAKPKSKKKLILILVTVLIITGAGAGAGYFFIMKKSKNKNNTSIQKPTLENNSEKKAELFLNLNDLIVNLQEGTKQPSFLKMKLTLQISNQDVLKAVQIKMPIIQDCFQTYLRELRADDLHGSAGIYRLREELLLRINKIIFPEMVTDILFQEFLVQ